MLLTCILSGCSASPPAIPSSLAATNLNNDDDDTITPVEISNAHVDENGDLIITLSDGRSINAGNVKGDKGEPGQNGRDGIDGTNGAPGRDGVNGEDGVDGRNGKDGKDGVDGAPGRDGKDGINGRDGWDGVAGTPGANGTDGKDGFTPHIGTNGNWYVGIYDTGVKATGSIEDNFDEYVYDETGKVLLRYLGVSPTVNIPEGTVEIGERAFAGIRNLRTVNFPSTVEIIGESAFSECVNLAYVNLNLGLIEMKTGAFTQCVSLKAIEMPRTLKRIGVYAFMSNHGDPHDSLDTVILNEGLEYIDSGAFMGVLSKSIILPSTLKEIGDYSFANSSLESITIPASVEFLGENAFSGTNIDSFEFVGTLPPSMEYPLAGTYFNYKLIVPVGYLNAYIIENPLFAVFFYEKGEIPIQTKKLVRISKSDSEICSTPFDNNSLFTLEMDRVIEVMELFTDPITSAFYYSFLDGGNVYYISCNDVVPIYNLGNINVVEVQPEFSGSTLESTATLEGIASDTICSFKDYISIEVQDNDIVIVINPSDIDGLCEILTSIYNNADGIMKYDNLRDRVSIKLKPYSDDNTPFQSGTVISLTSPKTKQAFLLNNSSKYININDEQTYVIDSQNCFSLTLSGFAYFLINSIEFYGTDKLNLIDSYSAEQWVQILNSDNLSFFAQKKYMFPIDMTFTSGDKTEAAIYDIYYEIRK